MVLEGGNFVNPDLYSPETGNNPKLTVAQFVRNNARSNVRFFDYAAIVAWTAGDAGRC